MCECGGEDEWIVYCMCECGGGGRMDYATSQDKDTPTGINHSDKGRFPIECSYPYK